MDRVFSSEGVNWEVAEGRSQGVSDIDGWKSLAEGLLTEQPCVFHRNLEISALYSGLYLRKPQHFKWAGMAALASYHVRDGLKLLTGLTDKTGRLSEKIGGRNWIGIGLDDVDVLRQTNNTIFSDIAWAHLAVALRGVEEFDEMIGAVPRYEGIGRAFSQMETDVWLANLTILRHEQEAMVQPNFDKMSRSFSIVLSMGASMFYQDCGICQRKTNGLFFLFMIVKRMGFLLRSRSFPKITDLDQRWEWIANSLVPGFRSYEQGGVRIKRDLKKIFEDLANLENEKKCSV